MTRKNDSDLQRYAPGLIRFAVLLFFIFVGAIHQLLMYWGITESIYVFVQPPERIYPFTTLEFQWWWVLLLGSLFAFAVAYFGRVRGIQRRFSVPFYAYTLFLLFLVRPINNQPPANLLDLTITQFTISPPNPTTVDNIVVTIEVQNQGTVSTDTNFWTDFYVNPITLPSNPGLGADRRWKIPAVGSPRGIAWNVPALEPGATMILTSDGSQGIGPTLDPPNNDITHWEGTLPPGSYALYAFADSYDNTDPTRATNVEIVEINEINNLGGPLNLTIAGNPEEGDQTPIATPLPPGPRPDVGQ